MTTGYVVGPALIGVGVLVLYGSVSGRLPAMIAALFDPSLLTPRATTPRTSPAPGLLTRLEKPVLETL